LICVKDKNPSYRLLTTWKRHGTDKQMAASIPKSCAVCSMYAEEGNLCATLDPDEISKLNAGSHLALIGRGESISEDVMTAWPILAVESGELSLQYTLLDGRRTIASFFLTGDIIDLRHTDERRLGNLIALSNVTFCKLSPKIFDRIVANNPEARTLVWSNLQAQVYRSFNHIADLAKKKAVEKLASFILECRNRHLHPLPDHVSIPVRRRDLAEYLGMQPETISRCFRELEERGTIEVMETSVVRLLRLPDLRLIANGAREECEAPGFKVLQMGPERR
jgi:CRP/FNR family transcriptional regulator, anaerobic regulatory protein